MARAERNLELSPFHDLPRSKLDSILFDLRADLARVAQIVDELERLGGTVAQERQYLRQKIELSLVDARLHVGAWSFTLGYAFQPLSPAGRAGLSAPLGLGAFKSEPGAPTEHAVRGALEQQIVGRVARKVGRGNAQVLLRWDLRHGVVTIPKSVRRERIEENARIFDFELEPPDMAALDALDAETRIGPHPDRINF